MGPRWTAVADVNGDGIPDLVTVANFSTSVNVLLGNGDGTFQAPVKYGTGPGPAGMAVGDFTGSGIPDIVTANTSDTSVSVLLGNGDGSFQDAVDYAVGAHPQAVAVGGFTGGGVDDVVTANTSSGTVSVLLSNGDGTFQTAMDYAVGTYPRDVAVGDFNGDGLPDLVTANHGSNTVSVLLNDGHWPTSPGNGSGHPNPLPKALFGDVGPLGSAPLVPGLPTLPPLGLPAAAAPLPSSDVLLRKPDAASPPIANFTARNAGDARWGETGDPLGDGTNLELGDTI
jgi:hypothetical protein